MKKMDIDSSYIFVIILFVAFLIWVFVMNVRSEKREKTKKEITKDTNQIDKRQQAENFRVKASKYYKENNLYEAIDSLRESIKQFETAEAYALLAYYTRELEHSKMRTKWNDFLYGMFASDYENVAYLYTKALSLDCKNKLANLGLCDYYTSTHRLTEAVNATKNALIHFPDILDLHANLGKLYLLQCNLDDAILELLYVADIRRDEESYMNLSSAFLKKREYNSAMLFARLVLQKNPNNEEAKSILSKCEYKKNNPPISFNEIVKNILKYPQFIFLYSILSIFLLVAIFAESRDLFDGYYMLLRVITCATCVYSAVKFKTEWAKWIFGVLAVLYNPVLPVHLSDKDLWSIINFATAVYMWVALFAEIKLQQKGQN